MGKIYVTYISKDHKTYELPWWLGSKEFTCNAGDFEASCWIPGLGRRPGGGNGNPHQYSYLGNPMDRGAQQATVHRITKESKKT